MVDFTKPTTKLGLPRLFGNGPDRYTDHMELLSPGVTIAYKHNPAVAYPTLPTKNAVRAAAVRAMAIMRKANDELAKVVILRKAESALFQTIMQVHFQLVAGNTAGLLTDNIVDKQFSLKEIRKHDRRWVLEKIRKNFLSLSFHLNTGVYLIDTDHANRTVVGGVTGTVAAAQAQIAGSDGYTLASSTPICGFKNGEIHLDLSAHANFSVNSFAAIIIHEACHKYLGIGIGGAEIYADDPNYYNSGLAYCIGNPDCYTWAAVSLFAGALKMPNHASGDWFNA